MGLVPVVWSAPETCATGAEMVAAVEERLGDARVELTDLTVAGRAEREDAGWVAVLVLQDAEGATMGERRVHDGSPDCRALSGPVSLVIAMMLRQHVTKADFYTPPTPPAPPPPPPVVAQPKPARMEQPRGLRIVWTSAVSYCMSIGILPTVGMGASARIDNRFGDYVGFAIEVGGEGSADVRPFAASAGAVSFSMFEAAARLHVALVRSRWVEVQPAIVARAGVVWARAHDFDAYNRTDVSGMATIGAGVLLSVRLASSLRLEATAEAAFPLIYDELDVAHGGDTITLRNAPIAAHFQGGLAWRLE